MSCLGTAWSKLHFCWLGWSRTAAIEFQRYMH